jgi:hypothetical protein
MRREKAADGSEDMGGGLAPYASHPCPTKNAENSEAYSDCFRHMLYPMTIATVTIGASA